MNSLINLRSVCFSVTNLAFSLLVVATGFAQIQYPFELPTDICATLNIDTSHSAPISSMLLGLNCNWPEGQYGKTGYNNPVAQKLIREFKPVALRFPHGVWANFYDWESDGRRITDDYKTPYDSSVKEHPELKYGFDGFHKLHQELDFEVLLTFNVNYDSPEKSAARLIDRRDKGFDVKRIELGNEIFWKTQRSNAVSDVVKYIAVSKAHAAALKAVDPQVKISVPVHWRNSNSDPWNMALKSQDYFDAITVHKHMGFKEDRDGAAEALGARETMVNMAKEIRRVFPGKPFWISEWSVGCGENAISILGMADTYLGLFEHPELFEVADYFQINASHALIAYDQKTGVHTRTSFGAAFEIIRSVFDGAEVYSTQITATQIGSGPAAMNAVNATAVIKDGKTVVLAINKTTKPVPFNLCIDGATNAFTVNHQALSFEDLNELKSFAMAESVMAKIESGAEGILLPPLSINRIELNSR